MGSELKLTCIAEGNPKPTVIWSKDGSRFTAGETLTISEVNLQNAGDYQCLADNVIGTHHKTIHITVQGR